VHQQPDVIELQLGRFLNFIRRALERVYAALSDITAPSLPEHENWIF
jgi:hypothetical protein